MENNVVTNVHEDLYRIGLCVSIMNSLEELRQHVAANAIAISAADLQTISDAFFTVARIGGFNEEKENGEKA